MNTYDGPATVIVDGADYEVEASLEATVARVPVPGRPGESLEGLAEWGGTLQAQDDEAAWNIHQADQARLRIEGGDREGMFIVTHTSVGASTLTIQGSGAAPFGH